MGFINWERTDVVSEPNLSTANNIGGGSGLPNGPTPTLDSEQLSKWAVTNFSGGAQDYSDKAMWAEFVSGPAYKSRYGMALTRANYVNAAKQESQRLFNLGFIQVGNVENARRIYESYGRAAGETFSYFPVTEDTALALNRAADMYDWEYIAEGAAADLAIGVYNTGGKIVKKSGDKLEDLGEVLSNPLTLPAIAVLALVGVFLFVKAS